MKNLKSLKLIPAMLVILILAQLLVVPVINKRKAFAEENVTAQDEEISQTEKQIEELKKQQEEINKQIELEGSNQEQLKSDAEYIQSVIKQNELKVESLKLELNTLDLEVKRVGENLDEIEIRIAEIKKDQDRLNGEIAEYVSLLYKMSFNNPSILDEDSDFQDTVISQEKTKAVVRLIKSDLETVKKLEVEMANKQEDLAAQEKELENFQAEKVAQNANLRSQQDALEWQKNNKEQLAKESINKQNELVNKNEELNQKIAEITAKLNELRNQAITAPPSGNQIGKGQIVGYEGRTGYVCGYISPEQLAQIPPEDYATSSQYCPAPLYFLPNISKYPLLGAHLHFEFKVGAEWVDPSAYYSTFDRAPMDSMNVTQGFSGGHLANDIDGGYGAPVYAVKPGQVQYFCDNIIPGNPGYGAVVVHDDGTRSLYWHLQQNANSPACTPLNYNY